MITTHLPDYVDYLYKDGVRPVNIGKIPAMKVGYFLVFKMADLIQAHPGMEFGHRRSGPALDLLGEIQMAYMKKENITAPTLYSMIYDHHPEKGQCKDIYPLFQGARGSPVLSLGGPVRHRVCCGGNRHGGTRRASILRGSWQDCV